MIAPIHSEPGGAARRETTFHPFALIARHAAGTVPATLIETPLLEAKRYGEDPGVDAVVTHHTDQGTLTVNGT